MMESCPQKRPWWEWKGRKKGKFQEWQESFLSILLQIHVYKMLNSKSSLYKMKEFCSLMCAKSLNSSDPEFHFSYAKSEGSTMKLSKQHGVSCHKRQFPAFTKQIPCRGTDVSVFLHELSELFTLLLESLCLSALAT